MSHVVCLAILSSMLQTERDRMVSSLVIFQISLPTIGDHVSGSSTINVTDTGLSINPGRQGLFISLSVMLALTLPHLRISQRHELPLACGLLIGSLPQLPDSVPTLLQLVPPPPQRLRLLPRGRRAFYLPTATTWWPPTLGAEDDV